MVVEAHIEVQNFQMMDCELLSIQMMNCYLLFVICDIRLLKWDCFSSLNRQLKLLTREK